MEEKIQKITISDLDAGEACVYEIRYEQAQMNDDFKVWFSIQQNLNATIADGLEKHPYLYTTTESMNFVPFKLDKIGEKFELGDLWWGEEYNGIAYLIVSSEVTDSFGTFNYGKKEPIGKWIMWVAIGVSLFVLFACLFICCCYVRRMYNKKKQKKGQAAEFNETRIEKYKYTPREATLKTHKTEVDKNDKIDDFYNINGPYIGGPTSAEVSSNRYSGDNQFPFEKRNLIRQG